MTHSKTVRPHAKKRQGAARRPNRGAWAIDRIDYSEATLGPDVVTSTVEEVMAELETLPPDLPWTAVSRRIIPLFGRVRPYPGGSPDLVRAVVPPGVSVGFAINVPGAFLNVTPDMLGGWSLSVEALAEHALGNLRSIATLVEPREVIEGAIGDASVDALQTGRSIGSLLVLAPDQLGRLFGARPRLFVAPMRDLLLAMPADVDRELAAWIYAEIASQDPNCLSPLAFAFDGRAITIEPLGPAFGEA